MKLKKLAAGILAAIVAMTSVIVTPVVANAADEMVDITSAISAGISPAELEAYQSLTVTYSPSLASACGHGHSTETYCPWAAVAFVGKNVTSTENDFTDNEGNPTNVSYWYQPTSAASCGSNQDAASCTATIAVSTILDSFANDANWLDRYTLNSVGCTGWSCSVTKVEATPVDENGPTEPYVYAYDGSPLTLTVQAANWTESGLAAQLNHNLYPDGFTSGTTTYGDLTAAYTGITVSDWALQNVPNGLDASGFATSVILQYNENYSGWASTDGTSVNFLSLSIPDDAPIMNIIFQINYNLPVGTTYKEGDTIVINGAAEPEAEQYWLSVFDYNYGVVSLYDSEDNELEVELDPNSEYHYHITEGEAIMAVFESDEWEIVSVELIVNDEVIETFTEPEFVFEMPSADAELHYNCKVIPVPVEYIRIVEDSITLNVGDEVEIEYYVGNEDHTDTIVWTSSAPSVAAPKSEDSNVVVAYAPGKATITASSTYSDAEDSIEIIVVIDAPEISSATAGNGQVGLTWGAVEGASSYRVMVWDGTKWTGYSTAETSYTVTGLTNGKKYAFAVKAYSNGAYTDVSDIVYATPYNAEEIVPTGVKAGAGDAKVQVKWNAVAGASSYRVMVWDGTKWTGYNTAETSYMVRNLTNNKMYAFAVKAYVNGAFGDVSTILYAVPHNDASKIPAGVTAAGGNESVTVEWDTVYGASYYRVMVWDGTSWTGESTTSTTLTVDGLTNGKKYAFAVKTRINGAWTDISTIVYATPNA